METQLLFAGQGGGSRGCFPAGALFEYFEHAGEVQAYGGGFGVSVGALTVSQLLAADAAVIPDFDRQRQNVAVLRDFWLKRIGGDASIYRPWPKRKGRTFLLNAALSLFKFGGAEISRRDVQALAIALSENKPSVYDNAPLVELVRDALAGKRWHPSVRVGLVNLRTGSYEEKPLADNPDWLQDLIASTVIPLAFPPVRDTFDGGVTDLTPLKGVFTRFRELRAAQPGRRQELHVYRCSPFPRHADTGKRYATLSAILFRLLDIMVDNTDEDDFAAARLRNDIARIADLAARCDNAELRERLAQWREKYGFVNIYVIGPAADDESYLPVNSRSFQPSRLQSGFVRGRMAMMSFLKDKERFRLENLLTSPAD